MNKTITKIKRLINTSITYSDGSKTERYTDTGNYDTASFKAVPYEYDSSGGYTEKVKRYFIVYKRCISGCFGEYLSGIRVKHNTIAECIKEINQYLKSLEV